MKITKSHSSNEVESQLHAHTEDQIVAGVNGAVKNGDGATGRATPSRCRQHTVLRAAWAARGSPVRNPPASVALQNLVLRVNGQAYNLLWYLRSTAPQLPRQHMLHRI